MLCFSRTKFFLYPRASRRKLHVGFRCRCEACTNDYKPTADLPWSKLEIPKSIVDAQLLLLSEPSSRKKAIEFHDICAEHQQKLDEHLPCKDWTLLDQVFGRCVMRMYEKGDWRFLHKSGDDEDAMKVL